MHALVKLVVSDVDGTLIYKGSYLNTARFPVMLKNLGDLNIPFCVATGRHYRELKKLFGNYCDTILCVCCDGAYAVFANKLLFGIPVGTEAVKNFFDAFVGKNIPVEFHSPDTTYILGGSPLFHSKEKSRLSEIKVISSPDEAEGEIFMISVYGNICTNADLKNFTLPGNLRVSYSSGNISEFVSSNASKYGSISKIASSCGISEKDILFFGDGQSDAELIEKCALSYTTYCADRKVFRLTGNHTRDVIGTLIRLSSEWKKQKQKQN